jgi:hypothetical protein
MDSLELSEPLFNRKYMQILESHCVALTEDDFALCEPWIHFHPHGSPDSSHGLYPSRSLQVVTQTK